MTTSNAKKHLFFIEIVGHAMRGLALAAKNQGHHVTGLDENATPMLINRFNGTLVRGQ